MQLSLTYSPQEKNFSFPLEYQRKEQLMTDFFLADQTRGKLSDELTLKDIYESTKLKTVRLYVVTTAHTIHLNGNNSKDRNNTEQDISAQLIHPNQSNFGQKSPQVQAEDNIRAISSVSTTELPIPDSNQAETMMDGVSRDAYAAFWESIFLRNADGEVYRIPVLSQDYGQEEWEAVGRILVKGYKEHKYYPISLAPAFFIAVLHGENSVTPQLLKHSFRLYISQSKKDVIDAVEIGTQYDKDELLILLDRFQCHKIPEL
ncbi:hypothetical protein ACJMK2_012033, partial [Sinanodonta woodiana]